MLCKFCLFFILLICLSLKSASLEVHSTRLTGVIFSANKDIPILKQSVTSALQHLNLELLYIVVSDEMYPILNDAYTTKAHHHRVRIVNDQWLKIPISKGDVKDIMIEAIRRANIYQTLSISPTSVPTRWESFTSLSWLFGDSNNDEATGLKKKKKKKPKSEVELYIDKNYGWYWQQLMKLLFYKAMNLKANNINKYVVIDGDVVWHKDVELVHSCQLPDDKVQGIQEQCRYNYVTSFQHHLPYLKTLNDILGIDMLTISSSEEDKVTNEAVFRSGIAHHMVFSNHILDDMIKTAEDIHESKSKDEDEDEDEDEGRFIPKDVNVYEYIDGGVDYNSDSNSNSNSNNYGEDNSASNESVSVSNTYSKKLSFAEIFLMHAANNLICGKNSMCKSSQTISEYELYFQFTRKKYPDTISLRPLLWANGPKPGLLYWPNEKTTMKSNFNWQFWKQKKNLIIKELQKDFYDVRNEMNWVSTDENDPNSGIDDKKSTILTIKKNNTKILYNNMITTDINGRSFLNKIPQLEHSSKLLFDKQLLSDQLSGYDYVAYHKHSLKRNYEMISSDIIHSLCKIVVQSQTEILKSTEGKISEISKSSIIINFDKFYKDTACSFKRHIDNLYHMEMVSKPKKMNNFFKYCSCIQILQVKQARGD
jgi:hypothetical protein